MAEKTKKLEKPTANMRKRGGLRKSAANPTSTAPARLGASSRGSRPTVAKVTAKSRPPAMTKAIRQRSAGTTNPPRRRPPSPPVTDAETYEPITTSRRSTLTVRARYAAMQVLSAGMNSPWTNLATTRSARLRVAAQTRLAIPTTKPPARMIRADREAVGGHAERQIRDGDPQHDRRYGE